MASLATVSTFDLTAIEAGVPLVAITNFVAQSGLQLKDIYQVVIPARTLKHRRERKEPLNLDESDKLARLMRVYEFAVKVFADKEKALRWLNKPKHRFAERTPIQMLRTELGGRMVEEMLGQIEHGMFA
jgi:putative toxin-antitoxin system antitoxin component (TIGR02293 family)